MDYSHSHSNGEYERTTTCLLMLPEDCTAKILAFTSPVDVCRLSLVSKSVQSVADSDSVWEKFLPSYYQSIIASSLSPIPDFPSKKDLYVYLCHNPLLIDAARKSFSLDKWTGKKCYFLGARDLNIAWGDTPVHWKWTSLPESRFPEVAELICVWWLEIRGTIRAGILSPRTSYAAYLVYKLEDDYGFQYKPSEISVGISGFELDKRFARLVPEGRPQPRNHYEESVYTLPSDAEDEPWQPDDYEESVYTLPFDAEDEHGRPDDCEESVYTLPFDAEDEPGRPDDCEESVYTLPFDAEDEPGRPNDYEESVYTLLFDTEDEPGRPDDNHEESVYSPPSDAEGELERPDDDYEESVYTLPSNVGYWRRQYLPENASSLMQSNIQRPKLRDDGWFEIELGEFYTENEDDCIEMSLKEVEDCVSQKEGLIVEGIEIRPRMG